MLLVLTRVCQMDLIGGILVVAETHALGGLCMEHVRGRKLVVWVELEDENRVIGVAIAVGMQILVKRRDLP